MNVTADGQLPVTTVAALVLATALFYAAFRVDTGGPPGAARRATSRLLVVLTGVLLVVGVVVAARA